MLRLLSILLFLPFISLSQLQISNIEKYTINNGLSNNHVGQVFQDSRAFIWITSTWGLNRYDGRTFRKFTKTGKGTLITANVKSIAEDRDGNIWLGSDNGICIFNPFTEEFTHWPHNGTTVFMDRNKTIWVSYKTSVAMANKNGIIKRVEISRAMLDKRESFHISDVYEDSKGTIWVATSIGITQLDKISFNHKAHLVPKVNKSGWNSFTKIYEDEKKDLYAGTWGNGVYKLNRNQDRFEPVALNETDHSVHDISDLTFNDRNYLLLATQKGLIIVSNIAGRPLEIENVIESGEYEDKLIATDVNSILKDRQGNLWISCFGGLNKIDMSRQSFMWKYLPGYENKDRVVYHVVKDISPDNNNVYLTTMEGWWKLNLNTSKIEKHMLPKEEARLASFINRYLIEKDGYWFTSQFGFGYYDLKKNKISNYSNFIESGDFRSWFLIKDHAGKLWISVSRKGLRLFDPATKKVEKLFADSTKENLIGETIRDMKMDKEGFIWLSTGTTLYKISQIDHSFTKYPLQVKDLNTGIHFDQQQRLLLYNSENILEFKNGKTSLLYPQSENPDFLIEKLVEDGSGYFWIKTNNGFYKVSPDFKTWRSYTSETRLNGMDQIVEISMIDEYFIATGSGKILYFDLNDVGRDSLIAPVVITRLAANGKNLYFPGLLKQKISVSYKDKIEIELAALNFSNEQGNRIFYKLEGWDEQWKELVSGSVLQYEQLPSGDYKLLVKAINGDKEISSAPAMINFMITPPFWQTWWFIGLCLITVSAILYLIYRYRLQQALKMERLRTRIATDLHDDIGATLSSISMYSEAVKNQVKEKLPNLEPVLEKMGENSRSMVGSMSDIVWAINPDNDDAEKLLLRMENYARDNCSINNIQLHFYADENLKGLSLSLEQRKNIYLIFKESLNNALKYSAASNIYIRIEKKANKVHLSIRDDGKGFCADTVKKGNGLKNLQMRATEINGLLNIETANGTEIKLSCSV